MGNDTAVVKLSSLVRVKGGKRLPKGTNLQVQKNAHPYIRVRDMGEMFIPTENLEYVPDEVFPAIKNYIVNKDDILISIVGTIGLISIVDDNHHLSSQTENCAKLHGLNGLDVYYLYYYLTSNYGQEEIKRGTVGAVQAKLPLYAIENIDVIWPEKERRRSIALLLKSIDDKIHINRQINQTLTQMAQTLFNSWFVDFDPVIDNALDAGFFELDLGFSDELLRRVETRKALRASSSNFEKNKPLPDAIRQLFPSAFESSDLGWIPKGWEALPLSDVCSLITDGAHTSPTSINDGGYPMASVKDMHSLGFDLNSCRRISEEDYLKLVASNCKPQKGDILIAKDGSYLKHVFTLLNDIDIVILSSIAILRPNEKTSPYFLSLGLKQPNILKRMENYVSGAVIQRIILKDFKKFPIIVTPYNIQEYFDKKVELIFERCASNLTEIDVLGKLRGILLPKLISGELCLDNIAANFAKEEVV